MAKSFVRPIIIRESGAKASKYRFRRAKMGELSCGGTVLCALTAQEQGKAEADSAER